MGMLTFWVVVTVVMSHLCSLLEVTLFSVRTSALLERRAASGPRGFLRSSRLGLTTPLARFSF